MRNGQNNKRMRNRNNNNNNNRRGQNPMTRVYESNGPDIKIRGTASHVAEKYVQLAREFTPLSQSQMAALAQKAEPIAQQALFFRFLHRG